jgi:hypothetical protein
MAGEVSVVEMFPLQCQSTLTAWTDRSRGEVGTRFEHGLSLLRNIRENGATCFQEIFAGLVRCFNAHDLHRSRQEAESTRGGYHKFPPLTRLKPHFFCLLSLRCGLTLLHGSTVDHCSSSNGNSQSNVPRRRYRLALARLMQVASPLLMELMEWQLLLLVLVEAGEGPGTSLCESAPVGDRNSFSSLILLTLHITATIV